MSLDMSHHVMGDFVSRIPGGVRHIRVTGDYTGAGGVWQESRGPATTIQANVQPASWKTAEMLVGAGRATRTEDIRSIHINDGVTYLQPKDDNKSFDLLEFSDGIETREWLVVLSDNRPWRNYCRAHVVRYRGQK